MSPRTGEHHSLNLQSDCVSQPVSVAGSAVKWLRDGMNLIDDVQHFNALAASCEDTGGLYFVTALSGLLAPYWDPGAAGLLIGIGGDLALIA